MRLCILTFPVVLAFCANASDYATYIGDAYKYQVTAITTDASGNTYVTGSRAVVAQTPSNLTDIFVSKLDASGNLTLIATLSGKESDQANGIALDPVGNIYIVGSTSSSDFPLHHPLQSAPGSGLTGFLVKMAPDGTLLYSTYLGGTIGDSGMNSVASDAQGNAYVTGLTFASDYPRTAGLPAAAAAGPGPGEISVAFFAKISPAGDKILFAGGFGATTRACDCCSSCFLSTLVTTGTAIAVDAGGNVYIAGNTNGLGLPTTSGALLANGIGAFVAKVNASGTGIAYMTYLGAGVNSPGIGTVATDGIASIAVDASGNAYLCGYTADPNFPATTGAFQSALANPELPPFAGPPDAFVAKLNPTGGAMVWATYLGGAATDRATALAVDPGGDVWVSGTTDSFDFPISAGLPGGGEFLAEFNPSGSALLYGIRAPANSLAAALAVDTRGVIHTAGATGVLSTLTPSLSSAPRFFGLTNAAGGSFGGRLAPGEVISIYGLHLGAATPVSAAFNSAGFLPTTLGGLEVSINGTPAPLLYVSSTQINAVAPIELGGLAGDSVQLTMSGAALPPFRLVVDSAEPEVFRNADRNAAAINQDGTVNSSTNPAKAGSIVSIWATGVGSGTLGLADGQQQTAAQPGCACIIHNLNQNKDIIPAYAGAAPGMVNGVVQINFQVGIFGDAYFLAGSPDWFAVSVAP